MPHGSISSDNYRKVPQHETSEARPQHEFIRTDSMGFALAEGRLDALRSMVLLVLREIDALKKMLSPEFPRQKLAAGFDLAKELSEIEKAMINTALLKTRGNQVAAAKLLSIKTTTLHEKIKRYRIHKPIGR